jgi:hypothetical protein
VILNSEKNDNNSYIFNENLEIADRINVNCNVDVREC